LDFFYRLAQGYADIPLEDKDFEDKVYVLCTMMALNPAQKCTLYLVDSTPEAVKLAGLLFLPFTICQSFARLEYPSLL